MSLEIRRTIADPLFQSNCYVCWCTDTGEGVVSDPGRIGTLTSLLQEEEITLTAIVNTHAHLDHVVGAAEVQRELDIPFALHPGDKGLLSRLNDHTSAYGLPEMEKPRVDRWLEDGDEIRFGNQKLSVIHTPGHSPGGICLHAPGHLLVGDTLFQGSVGRSDLEGGNHEQLINSIKERILTLPADTVLYPGHGPTTTVGAEAASNPFLQ